MLSLSWSCALTLAMGCRDGMAVEVRAQEHDVWSCGHPGLSVGQSQCTQSCCGAVVWLQCAPNMHSTCASNTEPNTRVQRMHTTDVSNMCMHATCPMTASSTRIQHIFSVWPTYAPSTCIQESPAHAFECMHPTCASSTQYVHPMQWHCTSISTAHGSLHAHCLETTSSCPDFFLC